MQIKKLLGNSMWMTLEKVINMGVNLLVTIWLARWLGPEEFGSLSFVLAIVLMVGPVSALGINAIITRELTEQPEREGTIMASAALLRFSGALLGVIAVVGWAMFVPNSLTTDELVVLIGLSAINSLHALQLVEFKFIADSRSHSIAKLRSSVTIVAALIKLFAAFYWQDMTIVALGYAFEYLGWGAGYYYLYQSKSNGFQWFKASFTYAIGLLKQSYWLLLSGIASVVYLKVDQLMLGEMVGREAVGVYAVAARLSEVWYFFANALVLSFFASLIQLRKTNSTQYRQRLQKLCDALFMLAFLTAIIVSLLAEPVVPWLFGKEYQASAAILSIHIWAAIFVFMRALASKWLIAERLLVFSLVSHGSGAVINILLNLLLIPLYEGAGAAMATIVSYAVASLFAFFFSRSTRPIAWVMLKSMALPLTLGARYWKLG